MKRYFLMILVVFLPAVLSGYIGHNRAERKNSCFNMPDPAFGKADYEKLYALQLKGYEDMTVSDFQERIWKMTDTAEYLKLLEKFSESKVLYELKDTDETASFLFYILEPLTAENWQTHEYKGAVTSSFSVLDNAALEYTYTLDILDAEVLTVKEYNDMRLKIRKAMQDVLKNKTKEELMLQNENTTLAEIQDYVNENLGKIQTKEMSAAIDYVYFPLNEIEEQQGGKSAEDSKKKERRTSNGTEEDYRSLLALKTQGYQNMTLADFNTSLLDWANKNYDRMERIGEDTAWNDFQINLTADELSFIKLTVFLSGIENGKYAKYAQSHHMGKNKYSVYKEDLSSIYMEYLPFEYQESLPQKTMGKNKNAVWASLCYEFSYCISDPRKITVGERDACIGGMINAVRKFWNGMDMEDTLRMGKKDIAAELQKIAAVHITKDITISIEKKQVLYECVEER